MAWTTNTYELSDRVVLCNHYDGKIWTESWFSLQYGGETKGYRDKGNPSKRGFLLSVLRYRLRTTTETIQPNNKAPRRTLLFVSFVSFVMRVREEVRSERRVMRKTP